MLTIPALFLRSYYRLNFCLLLGVFIATPIVHAHDGADHALFNGTQTTANNNHAESDYLLAKLARERDEQAFIAPRLTLTKNQGILATVHNNLPETPSDIGQWGPVVQWPFAYAAAASLPDGRIIAWGGNNPTSFTGGNFTHSAVWDPVTGQFLSTPNANHSMFCGIPTTLEDGRVIVNGGDAGNVATMYHTSIFDYRTNQWQRVDEMNNPRWYAGSVALPSGKVFTAIGDRGTQYPELWTPGQGWSILSGVNLQAPILDYSGYQNNWLPYFHLAPNGQIFHSGPTPQMNWIDASGNGSVNDAALRNTWYSKYSVGVMYDEGKILVAGGAVDNTSTARGSEQAKIIDLTGSSPQQTALASMHHARKFSNGVVLPTGEVMVIGGNTSGIEFSDSGSILTPEIWNPDDGTWREVADQSIPRNYHSVALLMTDGRVWSGGGGLCACSADHPDSQVYSPAYLFNGDGSLAVRPTISSAPDEVYYGDSISVSATPAIAKFTMIKISATTHNLNSDLRFLNVPYTTVNSGSYRLSIHSNADVLTPGNWMLFAIDQQGVPSVAKVFRVSSFPAGSGSGEILREWWANISGAGVTDLVNNANYPDNPSGSDTQTSFEAPSDWADQYGTRMRGYLHPPVSGQYRFWIASDDGSQLLLSSDADPVNATPIASVSDWTNSRQWDKFSEQQSILITLQAGEKYYIEALQKEGAGGDNLAVAWQFEDGFRSVIAGQYLSPFEFNQSPTIVNPVSQTNEEGDNVSLAISASDPEGDSLTFTATELPSGLSINGSTGAITGTIAANTAGNYSVTVSVTDGTTSANISFVWSVLFNGGFIIRYDFENNQGWSSNPNGDDTATTGQWERANPESTSNNGIALQLGNAVSGQNILVTGALAGTSVGTHDIDNGKTSMRSPDIFIPSNSQATIMFSYYFAHSDNASSADFLRVKVVGNSTTTLLEELGANNNDAASWEVFIGSLNNFTGQTIHLEVEAADNDSGSLVEAAIDDVVITIAENNQSPVLTNPGDQTNTVGENLNLAITASDADGDPLIYNTSNLPPGINIDGSTGLISGTLTSAGAFSVDLTVSDGRGGADSSSFNWTVNDPPALVLSPIVTLPNPVNTNVDYTAVSSGGLNPRFKWNFGDNSGETSYSSSPSISHSFAAPGRYIITLISTDDTGLEQQLQFLQMVHAPLTINRPAESMSIIYEAHTGNDRIWNVNPDNNTVTVYNTVTATKVADIGVGASPRSLAITSDGKVWVTNSKDATVSIIDPSSFNVEQTLDLPTGSRPFGIVSDPSGDNVYITLEASGKLLRFDPLLITQTASIDVGENPRHLSINANGNKIYVSRFITPPVVGEDTANPQVNQGGGEVVVVAASGMTITKTILLGHSDRPDRENGGRGIPNYLGPMIISPDGISAWTPSKQDNIQRGALRDGLDLTFESSVRSISSRIELAGESEDQPARIDHDNGGVAVSGVFDRSGNHLFVALEGSREIAVIDNYAKSELFRFDVGRAPQGLAISADGMTLYVHNFMDRSITVHDLSDLFTEVNLSAQSVVNQDTLDTVTNEQLSASVLLGKQHFYDARDQRLARDAYMSCASCHNDGGDDGRVWDFTQFGEGLRNTISLNGHGGNEHGLLHWTANFDEVHDFEGQIRNFSGGTGLMTNSDFNATSDPLGAPKTGLSSDLDALAAYVNSLTSFSISPDRKSNGALTTNAIAGKTIFENESCATCHGGQGFTDSPTALLHDIGTIKPSSGDRIGGPLTGLDAPTLRGLWATAPYLHDGSAATLAEAVTAHSGISLSSTELNQLVSYLRQIDDQEPSPVSTPLNNPPSISNPGDQTATVGDVVSLDISASDPDGDSLVFSATGLPIGLSISNNDGSVGGSPTTSGISNVTVTVDDGNGGSDSVDFSWVIDSVTEVNRPPTILSPGDQTSEIGISVSLAINASDADGDSLSYNASDLPAGLTINTSTGVISGTPSAVDSTNVTITVQDDNGGISSISFNWAITAVNVDVEIVAHYKNDYQNTSPAPGWQYLWNEQGPIGQASGYSELIWNGSYYDSDGVFGLPDASDLTYGNLRARSGHTGRGESQGQINDRYVIAAFNVGRAGEYRIVQSQIIDSGCTRNGGRVEVYANDVFIHEQNFGPTTVSFDMTIGNLAAGDVIYVAVGPNGSDSCDGFRWDYRLEVAGTASGQNSAPILVNPGGQSSIEGDSENLVLSASDADGDALQFNATNLPPGLSIDSNSGSISGVSTTSGTYSVSVSVTDGQGGSDSVDFFWNVTTASGTQQVVAGYQTDFTGGTPSPGWLYLWNNSGPVGQSGNYTPLQWNGSYYDSNGEPGLPDASDLAYGNLRNNGGHPGRGVSRGQTNDRFVIAAYQVDQAGDYRIVQSQVTHKGCSRGNGIEINVYVNDTLLRSQINGQGEQTTFDQVLGLLDIGDTIYVALGPNGSGTCDLFKWDFMIEVAN